MTAARSRDRIAAQYADGYRDVFDIGVARVRSMADSDAVTMAEAVYLDFLTAFPDSHILRKHGEEVAASVLAEAREVRGRVAAASSAVLRREHLFVFDARLKWQGINPGTSADLTVASLFAHWLEGRQADRKPDLRVHRGRDSLPASASWRSRPWSEPGRVPYRSRSPKGEGRGRLPRRGEMTAGSL